MTRASLCTSLLMLLASAIGMAQQPPTFSPVRTPRPQYSPRIVATSAAYTVVAVQDSTIAEVNAAILVLDGTGTVTDRITETDASSSFFMLSDSVVAWHEEDDEEILYYRRIGHAYATTRVRMNGAGYVANDTVHMVTTGTRKLVVRRTALYDTSVTATTYPVPAATVALVMADPARGAAIVFDSAHTAYRTTDYVTYDTIPLPDIRNMNLQLRYFMPGDPNGLVIQCRGYAEGATYETYYRTTDGGTIWDSTTFRIADNNRYAMTMSPNGMVLRPQATSIGPSGEGIFVLDGPVWKPLLRYTKHTVIDQAHRMASGLWVVHCDHGLLLYDEAHMRWTVWCIPLTTVEWLWPSYVSLLDDGSVIRSGTSGVPLHYAPEDSSYSVVWGWYMPDYPGDHWNSQVSGLPLMFRQHAGHLVGTGLGTVYVSDERGLYPVVFDSVRMWGEQYEMHEMNDTLYASTANVSYSVYDDAGTLGWNRALRHVNFPLLTSWGVRYLAITEREILSQVQNDTYRTQPMTSTTGEGFRPLAMNEANDTLYVLGSYPYHTGGELFVRMTIDRDGTVRKSTVDHRMAQGFRSYLCDGDSRIWMESIYDSTGMTMISNFATLGPRLDTLEYAMAPGILNRRSNMVWDSTRRVYWVTGLADSLFVSSVIPQRVTSVADEAPAIVAPTTAQAGDDRPHRWRWYDVMGRLLATSPIDSVFPPQPVPDVPMYRVDGRSGHVQGMSR